MKKQTLFLLVMLILHSATFAQERESRREKKRKAKELRKEAKNTGTVKSAETYVIPADNGTLVAEPVKPNPTTKPQTTKAETQTLPTIQAETQTPIKTPPLVIPTPTKDQEVVVNKPQGQINWTQQYIEAKGEAVIDNERFKNPAQARAMASRGAVVVAQRNLLEIAKGVQVVGETTVQDLMPVSDYIYTRVEGIVRGAVPMGEAREVNGMMVITMRMPIYGPDGLSNVFEEKDLATARQRNGFKTAAPNTNLVDTSGGDVVDGSKPIVFNLKGNEIDPSMFPVILDDNGNVQFDFSTIINGVNGGGALPQYVQLTRDILESFGNQKAVDVIDMVQSGKGAFKLTGNSKKRVFWQRVGNVLKDVGTVLFRILI